MFKWAVVQTVQINVNLDRLLDFTSQAISWSWYYSEREILRKKNKPVRVFLFLLSAASLLVNKSDGL